MQLTPKIVLITLFLSFVSFSQDINISGTVTDSGGVGIEGAIVQLEKRGYKDTTGANGNFTITGTVGIINKFNQSFPDIISANIKNNSLCINLAAKLRFQFTTYNLQGKMISSIIKQLNSGNHSIKLPCTGSGVYIHKITTGKQELLLKSNSIGDISFGSAASIKESSSITTSKKALSLDWIDDVIKSTKPGYLNYRVIVNNSDTSNIEIKMITCAGTLTDIDGNEYHTIRIGNQVWTVENLRTTRYNDGAPIPHVTDSAEWIACNSGTAAYCYYDNDSAANAEKYGALYNWYTVGSGKLAPTGWHVPSVAEWVTLQRYLVSNGYNWDSTTTGNRIGKSMAAKTDWHLSVYVGYVGNDLSSNNRSGFSALPGGMRNNLGDFFSQGGSGRWWSTTESANDTSFANGRSLSCGSDGISWFSTTKSCGFSFRLLRD